MIKSADGHHPVRIDVATIGEAMLRFSVPVEERLEDAPRYDVKVAGAESNVAYALARIGLCSSWTSALPWSPLGRRVASTIAAGGVDLSTVHWSNTGRLGVYFIETGCPPRATTVEYDRADSVMARATPDMFEWSRICNSRFLHITGITLGLSTQSYEVGKRAMTEAHQRGCKVSFDVNYRVRLWDPESAARAIRSVAPMIDVLICTAEDARDLFGAVGTAEDVVHQLSGTFGAHTIVLTRGEKGAVALQDHQILVRPGYEVQTVDRIGAGDAFAAGLLWGLLDGSIETGLERGLAMSALKMTVHGDLFRFSRDEVMALLARSDREVRR